MDDKRAALLLAALALAGAGVRWVMAPRERAPGDVRLEVARGAPRPPLQEVASRAQRLARPLRPGERIDVDRADAVELTRLPRVGPALAQRMVAWRAAHGPFGGLARLDSVPGVGPRLLETVQPHVEFSGRRP
ncbi:MAG TPA: helix-hairpin-helix domain-containing protein [Nocardioides sp.]|nr:helix-hairpin-helix domain-containing protein [Nocardioides sp.]